MAYVPVPKDLTTVKTKVMFNLTIRQLICFGSGAAIGVPLFFILKPYVSVSAAAICMVLVMLPFFLLAMYLGQMEVALLAAVLGGCCLGFLCFNYKPAKIYLGDGGSTFLGFVLACLALYGGWSTNGFRPSP